MSLLLVVSLEAFGAENSEELILTKKLNGLELLVTQRILSSSETESILAKRSKPTPPKIRLDVYLKPDHLVKVSVAKRDPNTKLSTELWSKVCYEWGKPGRVREPIEASPPVKVLDVSFEQGKLVILWREGFSIFAEIAQPSSSGFNVLSGSETNDFAGKIFADDARQLNGGQRGGVTFETGKLTGSFTNNSLSVVLETEKHSSITFHWNGNTWVKQKIEPPK